MRRHQHGTLEKKGDSVLWHDTTYDVLELRGIIPVTYWQGECCFAGVRETWTQQLQVKGSSWGQQLDGESPEEQKGYTTQLRGAARSEQDQRGPQCIGCRFFASVLTYVCICIIIVTISFTNKYYND